MRPFDIEVDGAHIHGVESGQGEPLLLLHGWGANSGFWKETLPSLAQHYRVITFDWPGFGQSHAADCPFTIEWYTRLLARIMDVLAIPQAIVVGHSMGGMIATQFALTHPGRVRHLVPICPPLDGPRALPWRLVFASLPIIRWLTYLFSKIGWIRRLLAKGYFTYQVPMYPEVVADFGHCSYGAVILTALSIRRLNLAPRLSELRMPVHAFSAQHDRIVLPSQGDLFRQVPGATLTTYADCGHCPPVECPDLFVRDTLAALQLRPPHTNVANRPATHDAPYVA